MSVPSLVMQKSETFELKREEKEGLFPVNFPILRRVGNFGN